MVSQDELEQLYGPAARFSEHTMGQHIRYHLPSEPGEFTGTILWVASPGMIGSHSIGLHYIVARDGRSTWPDTVFPSDVLA